MIYEVKEEGIAKLYMERFREAARALRRLYYITGDRKYAQRADKVFNEGLTIVKEMEERNDEKLPF